MHISQVAIGSDDRKHAICTSSEGLQAEGQTRYAPSVADPYGHCRGHCATASASSSLHCRPFRRGTSR
eukprot:3807411-Lingulodinium_polyedra.AAC.1